MSKIVQYVNSLDIESITKYINISSIIILLISIIVIEIAYKKESVKTMIYGLELFVISTFILLIKNIPKLIGCSIMKYLAVGGILFIGYYIIKIMVKYTIKKKKELNQYSDIKEIVKEEPIKKETKRKNKQKEGEK